jgi:transcriptional regulator ATRX
MADDPEEVEEIESDSNDSFIDDGDNDEPSISGQDDGLHLETPLSEEEIEELIQELLEVESKAAEAQESLEDESLAKVEGEVRVELRQSLSGDDLDKAVADEMDAFREECEVVLDELETESAHLLEQLDGAGVALPSLYNWIESQAPVACSTETWKKRTHWVGSQISSDATKSVADAEKYLQTHRPVRKKRGKVLEEGASGFLGKRLGISENGDASTENPDLEWSKFNEMLSSGKSSSFGSKSWASVYLAETPQQAAELGTKFPGLDEVEEIDDMEEGSSDPFVAAAINNERELKLSEEQKKNFRKVKEEDDLNVDRKLQLHLKRRRRRNKCEQASKLDSSAPLDPDSFEDITEHSASDGETLKTDVHETTESSNDLHKDKEENDSNFTTKSRGIKRLHETDEILSENKKSRVVTLDSDSESLAEENSSAVPLGSVEENGSENYHCTACGNVAAEVHQHPLLNVIICRDCKKLVEEKTQQVKDSECLECYCGWCGTNSDLVSCSSCQIMFCTACIQRNLGKECLLDAQKSGWKCCCCTPEIIQRLRLQLEKASSPKVLMVSISDSDSGVSDSDNSDSDSDSNAVIRKTKRRRKKKIRRILDDAELGEETKRKIAIEKERQERLKSLQAKISTKSMMSSCASFTGNVAEGVPTEVVGDGLTGYVVNVVREDGEQAVTIPQSISAKLKAHQISGIRFMWQNIIQSIRKVQSGDKGLGCILAHTMGLGKTFQVIAFLYTAMRSVDLGLRTALIVTPVNVLYNWRHEFTKWQPSEFKPLRVYMLDDVPRERKGELLMKWRRKGGVFLIGYASFRNLFLGKHIKDHQMAKDIHEILRDGPDILVCDEAHMIKNTRADVTQTLKQVKCQRRIALTGSPLQNNLMEYYCMVDFVREGFLGSSPEFRNRFQNPIENGQHTNSTADDVKIMNQRSHILYEQLKGFVQRMDMDIVKKDLPPKTVFVIAVKLSPLQRKLYKRFLEVHGFLKDVVTVEKIRKSFFAGYQALAKIWNHPGILQLMSDDKDLWKREDAVENFLVDDGLSDDNMDFNVGNEDKLRNKNDFPLKKNSSGIIQENWWKDLLNGKKVKDIEYSGKMVLLLDILSMCSDVGDKTLVFSQSLSTLDLIEHYLSALPRHSKKKKYWKKGKDWYRLDGRTPGLERQKMVERFNDVSNKRVKCTLISTRAGSLGINLHAANRVIIVDGSWNPTYDLQAIFRVWRYGQTKPVFAYRLMAHGTMEEKIYKRQVTKESLAARVVDRQQVHRSISKEEMLHLFDFEDEEDKENENVSVEEAENGIKHKFPNASFSSTDKLMDRLLGKHRPRWIANYHEHETLLKENEEERLTKEEQDLAWEVYRRTLEWEEIQRNPLLNQESTTTTTTATTVGPQDPPIPTPPPEDNHQSQIDEDDEKNRLQMRKSFKKGSLRMKRSSDVPRKCTNLSHLLTLRSQGTKTGCTTVCGECANHISWEDLNKDSPTVA